MDKADIIQRLTELEVSSAMATGMLHHLEFHGVTICGPVSRHPGARAIGFARTLKFLPRREDVFNPAGQEYAERRTALWAALDAVTPHDFMVIDAMGDPHTGCVGEMLVTYFMRQGGVGIVADGGVRDMPSLRGLDLPIWSTYTTPNFADQATLFPYAHNVDIACGGVLVRPGDMIIADDDGAVVVPESAIHQVIDAAADKEGWEAFTRERLRAGGELSKYYPLNDEAKIELVQWKARQSQK